jgi:hypothetical protein
MAGIGPATSPLPRECSTTEPHGRLATNHSFGAGDEARTRDIQFGKLKLYQLSYTRTANRVIAHFRVPALKPTPTGSNYYLLHYIYSTNFVTRSPVSTNMVEGEGFEPSYSERTDLQSVAFNHSATPPNRTRDYADNLTCCQTYKREFARIWCRMSESN